MIHGKVISFLRRSGCNVQRGPKGLRNGSVYKLAKSENRALLTQDRDFMDSKRYPPKGTSGIVCIRVFPPTISNILNRMKAFVNETTPAKIEGKLTLLD